MVRLAPNKHVSLFNIHYKCPLAQCKMHASKIDHMKFKIQNDMRNDSFLDNLLPVAVAAPAVAIRLNSDPFSVSKQD